MTTETTTAKRAKTKAAKLTADKVRDLLDFDPATRAFTFRKAHGLAKAGDTAGERIRIEGKTYGAARLALFYLTGDMTAENARAAQVEAALTEATAKALDEKTLTAERLRTLLRYDAASGRFYRRAASGSQPVGSETGAINKAGYVYICLDGRKFRRARLVWLYTHGRWPLQVDHRSGLKDDDRLSNLREASQAQNNRNVRGHSLCGVKGVTFDKRRTTKPYDAKIWTDGKVVHLGGFATMTEAETAYQVAASKAFGKWAVSNRPHADDGYVSYSDGRHGNALAEIALADSTGAQ